MAKLKSNFITKSPFEVGTKTCMTVFSKDRHASFIINWNVLQMTDTISDMMVNNIEIGELTNISYIVALTAS
jgi:hypothetical protein